jgi:hypothetical protein
MRSYVSLALALVSCTAPRVHSTSHVPRDVAIVATDAAAAGATEITTVTVEAPGGIGEASKQLAQRVRERGGNVARIDRVEMRVEMVRTHTPTSYPCGAPKMPQTCHYVKVETKEVTFTRIEGRALRP